MDYMDKPSAGNETRESLPPEVENGQREQEVENAQWKPESDNGKQGVDAENPTLLVSIRDGLEAGMIETLLENAGIPVLRRYPETGQLLHMVMGTSLYGTELHVPLERLEEARALLADVTRGERGTASGVDGHWENDAAAATAGIEQSEVLMRPMAESDWGALEKLWTETPGVGVRYPDDSPEGLVRYLQRNPTTCFVAEDGGVIVGSILAGHDGRRGYLYHLAVSADHRRRGIGRALVDSAADALRAEGIRKAGLVVFQENEEGNPFWDAVGWSQRTDLMYRDCYLAREASGSGHDD